MDILIGGLPMRFWKRFISNSVPADESKKAAMLEAYTCWLKNEKLSRKQKRLLKELPNATDIQALKQLVDFTHYRFEERASIKPSPGAKERARAHLMNKIRGETAQPDLTPIDGLNVQPSYSPQAIGNETTDVLPMATSVPNEDELRRWNSEQPFDLNDQDESSMLPPYDTIRTLSRLHLRFELKDDDVYLADLGSSNAPYLDGEPVENSTIIDENATVQCGKITLKIVNIDRS